MVYPDMNKNLETRVSNAQALKALHKTIKKVTSDIGSFRFNTAISSLMIFLNEVENLALAKNDLVNFLKILVPFAPHIAQELAAQLGYKKLFDVDEWPTWDEKLVEENIFELVIQINGKTRGKVVANRNIDEVAAKVLAMSDPAIIKWLAGLEIKKVIFVQNRLINLLV